MEPRGKLGRGAFPQRSKERSELRSVWKAKAHPTSGHMQRYHYITQRYVTILIETWVMGRMYYLPIALCFALVKIDWINRA